MWKVIAEECRRAEVNALEWKLRETRRRHIDELARLAGSSSTERLPGRCETTAMSVSPGFGPVSPGAFSPGFRGGGAGRMFEGSMPEAAGPVLVSCRRDFGAHRIRLWVEDLASLGSARFHAIDEATGARMYRDIPDAALSRLLTVFRRSPTCDPDDVDDFLRAMLRACKIRMFPGGLDIALPSEQDLHPEVRPAPLNLRVMQHISAMGGQRPGEADEAGEVGQVSLGHQAAKTASAKSIPCMAVAPGPGSTALGVTPVMSIHHQLKPPRPSRPPGRPQVGMPKRPVRRVRPQSAPHTGRSEEPRASKAMEAAAHAARSARTVNGSAITGQSPCRSHGRPEPKSDGLHGNQSPSVPSMIPGAFRGRRARPTSAKALKHRRVVDDSVDSIIYEDDEEEQEEEAEMTAAAEVTSQDTSLTSGQDTRDTRDTRYGDALGDTLETLGETLGETGEVSESLDCGDCGQDSVDSVDCVSKLAEIHPDSGAVHGAVHGALGGNLEASHRPSSRGDISPSPYGAPLCLAPSLNVITQGDRIAEEPDQQRMREFPEVKMQEPGGTYGDEGPLLKDGHGDDVSEDTVPGGPVHVLIKDLHIEDFTALGALEPRSSSPPPRPEMSNVS